MNLRSSIFLLTLIAAMAALPLDCRALTGDVNGDGEVDVSDINIISNIILERIVDEQFAIAADINEDGNVDVSDLDEVINAITSTYRTINIHDKSLYNVLALPVLEITTVDGELPACDVVDAPEGAFGQSITNATKVPGHLVMTLLGDTIYDSGEYTKGESGITLKISGNTSAQGDYKPYKIKLQAKADLLCRDDSIYGDKEWRLLRDDRALNTPVGFIVNELVGLQWTPQWEFCNVFVNGRFRGLYILCETVKRNRSCRIDVEKSGYIVERDAYWWNEDVSFKSIFFNDQRYGWTFKYPDDGLSQQDVDYMSRCINAAESSIADGTYDTCLDVQSLAAWLLAHDLLGTWDSGGSNLFVTKRDSTSSTLLEMGCLWDFDSNRGMGQDNWSRYHISDDFYYPRLFKSNNRAFADAYTALWNQLKKTLRQDINERLDQLEAPPASSDIDRSRYYNSLLYGLSQRNISSNIKLYRNWFDARLTWLDNHIGGE